MYGVKWQHFKLVLVEQKYFTDPALPLGFPRIVNLIVDPKEREPVEPRYLHTWTLAHFSRILTGVPAERGPGAADPGRRPARLRARNLARPLRYHVALLSSSQ